MKTVCVLIGNSDDKLSQRQWAEFVYEVSAAVMSFAERVHFQGHSEPCSQWQNMACVVEIEPRCWGELREYLKICATKFGQDSIAVIEGETEFLKGGAS